MVEQFWHFSYPVAHSDGLTSFMMGSGRDEQDARMKARMYSRSHGSATVTNREGMVATYVMGVERFFERPLLQGRLAESAKVHP